MSEISTEWKELRPKIGNFIYQMDGINARVDAKLKDLQEKEERQIDLQAQIDEAYNKGIQDLYDAVQYLFVSPPPISERHKLFGDVYSDKIIVNNTPEEIIDKVNQWKAEQEKKEQELHVGDEILVIDSDPELNGRTFVIYEITDSSYYVIEPLTFYKDGFFKKAYIKNQIKKTGKHYDSIPLSKEENK